MIMSKIKSRTITRTLSLLRMNILIAKERAVADTARRFPVRAGRDLQ